MNKQVKLRSNDILSHLILGARETAMKIADTPEWEGGKGVLEMDIKVNGVVVDTEVFRKVLEDMYQQARKKAADSVDEAKYRERVEAAAKKILENQVDNVMDVLSDLQEKLYHSENLIKFEWDK
tara:strand:+ start:333 stop:704 length:372 start_codon:yes stop_codon:yes gene_type:complete